MIKTIQVKARGEIRTSQKTKNDYFIVEDFEDNKYVCYDTTLHSLLEVGASMELDVEPSKKPDGSPVIKRPKVEKPQATQPITIEPSGQEVGMCMKEIGEHMRAGTLTKTFGEADAKLLWQVYKTRIYFAMGLVESERKEE